MIRKGPAPPPVERVTIPEGLTLMQLTEVLAETDPRFGPQQMQAALADPAHPLDRSSRRTRPRSRACCSRRPTTSASPTTRSTS